MTIKLTTAEEVTKQQILDFVKYMDSAHSGASSEAQAMIKLAMEIIRGDEIISHGGMISMDTTMSLLAHLAIELQTSPAMACWIMGFLMGVKFSNKEYVDAQIADIK